MSATSPSVPSPTTAPPWVIHPSQHWVSARQFAQIYKRSVRRIQEMCKDGELIDFSLASYQDPSGRWYIRME